MRAPLFATAAALLLLTGCAMADVQAALQPYPPVPPPQAEVVTVAPVSEQPLIWQPGHWDWTGQTYAWTPGSWVLRAGHGTTWQDGYWTEATNGAWAWIGPHWQ